MSLHSPPQGSAISIEPELRGVVAIGAIESESLVAAALGPEFVAERDRIIARWQSLPAGQSFANIPGVSEVRAMFHRLDVDPTKTRPSSEALLRRVLQGKGLPEVSPIVDVCNLCSLDHQLPLGLYDAQRLRGGVQARVGREGEGYEGIRKARVQLAGRLLLADDDGPFGAPTSDSLRTSVSGETSHVLVVVFCPPDRADADLSTTLESVAERLTRFCAGRVRSVRVLQ
ncbi:MAG: hypothetical protein HOP12_09970 [Candidatus Eisenbacteria bacterium]|uniref:B3/B4 tRNA-binding domain-containing protein n=1 Tax=Eiseniibacteriota bacterium TaxID=2212470 RepID=A0A849SL69_UNCEI|nr:hypothetical protein [Candidatus Eisenbacteria bacterium]